MKVLIADDDRVLSQLICSVLRQAGHKPFPAFDAMQALMLAMRDPPDMVLLDVNMPGGSGLKTLNTLKSSNKTSEIPVIVVSGNEDATIPETVKQLGAARFVPKPIDPELLLEVIREVMEEEGIAG